MATVHDARHAGSFAEVSDFHARPDTSSLRRIGLKPHNGTSRCGTTAQMRAIGSDDRRLWDLDDRDVNSGNSHVPRILARMIARWR